MVINSNKRIAIIPARGGSKRIPRKNLLSFRGKPLLAWTIEAAIESRKFNRVLVSTEDSEIAEISMKFGASVPFLREVAHDDLSPVSEATLAALLQAENYWSEKYEVVAQLMPNCPLRTSDDIIEALENFELKNSPAQISCFKFGWMNPWWAAKIGSDSTPEFLFPEARKQRSQDLPNLYCPTGAIWLSRSEILKQSRTFYSVGHIFHPMPWMSAIDIDDNEDLEMASAFASVRANA